MQILAGNRNIICSGNVRRNWQSLGCAVGLSGSGNLIQGYYSQADTDKLRSKFMIKNVGDTFLFGASHTTLLSKLRIIFWGRELDFSVRTVVQFCL